jgi:hypothetical protein
MNFKEAARTGRTAFRGHCRGPGGECQAEMRPPGAWVLKGGAGRSGSTSGEGASLRRYTRRLYPKSTDIR